MLPVGSADSALLSINDNLGNTLQTVPLTGNVVRGSVRATLSGLTVTIINPTNNQYSADWSTTGPYSVDNTLPGISGVFDRSIKLGLNGIQTSVTTDWHVASVAGDDIRFSAEYPGSATFYQTVSPQSRVAFANCNLISFSDLIYRSAPAITYTLFDRSQANFVDLTQAGVNVRIRVRHHDRNIDRMFNDRQNVPQLLIETDRVVRIESK